eukprot:SAG31_NODE_321_length_17733_cov_41.320177_8_plen_149_part_00
MAKSTRATFRPWCIFAERLCCCAGRLLVFSLLEKELTFSWLRLRSRQQQCCIATIQETQNSGMFSLLLHIVQQAPEVAPQCTKHSERVWCPSSLKDDSEHKGKAAQTRALSTMNGEGSSTRAEQLMPPRQARRIASNLSEHRQLLVCH